MPHDGNYPNARNAHPRMLFKSRLLALSLAATLSPQALSQTGNAASDSELLELEEILVTGTRIKRADLESASPVAVIDRGDIENLGAADIGEMDDDSNWLGDYQVDDYLKHDLQLSYNWREREMRFTLGVDNLLDEEPPRVGTTVDGGHDSFTYSSRGRFLYLRAAKNF